MSFGNFDDIDDPQSPAYYDAHEDETLVMSNTASSTTIRTAVTAYQSHDYPLRHPDRLPKYLRLLPRIQENDRKYFLAQHDYWSQFELRFSKRDITTKDPSKYIASWIDLYDVYLKQETLLLYLLEQTADLVGSSVNHVASLAYPFRDFWLDAGYTIPKRNTGIVPASTLPPVDTPASTTVSTAPIGSPQQPPQGIAPPRNSPKRSPGTTSSVFTTAASTHAGSIPAASTYFGSTPFGSLNLGSLPPGSTPLGSTPVVTTTAGSTPVVSTSTGTPSVNSSTYTYVYRPPPHRPLSNHSSSDTEEEEEMGHYSLLPKFDHMTDPQTFVDLFKTWLAASGITDETKKKQNFLLALNTPTGQMWSSLKTEYANTAATTLQALIDAFMSDFSQKRAISMNDFLKTEMGAFESAMNFVIKMRYHFKLYMEGLPEKTQVEYTILKMQIPLMNFVKAGGTPATWENLITKVKEYQDLVPHVPTPLMSAGPSTSMNASGHNLQVNGDPVQLLMLQMEKMNIELNQLRSSRPRRGGNSSRGSSRPPTQNQNYNRKPQNNYNNPSRRGNYRGNSRNQTSNQNPRPQVDCHNCGRYGHYARDCRSPRRQQGRGNSQRQPPRQQQHQQQSYSRVQTVTANGQNYAVVPLQENFPGLATPGAARLTLHE